MNSFDDMDIDSMINDPFKNINIPEDVAIPVVSSQKGKIAQNQQFSKNEPVTRADYELMEKNHPLNDRVLYLEKNILKIDTKLETIKRIIEHQNKRIAILEEELDVLRKYLDKEGEEKDPP